MEKLISLLSEAKDVASNNDNVIGFTFGDRNKLRLHIDKYEFKDLVERLDKFPMLEVDVEEKPSEVYSYELSIEKSGITIFCLMTSKDYKDSFSDWMGDFEIEHAQAELTQQKRGKSLYEQKLEESGHKESDFA